MYNLAHMFCDYNLAIISASLTVNNQHNGA